VTDDTARISLENSGKALKVMPLREAPEVPGGRRRNLVFLGRYEAGDRRQVSQCDRLPCHTANLSKWNLGDRNSRAARNAGFDGIHFADGIVRRKQRPFFGRGIIGKSKLLEAFNRDCVRRDGIFCLFLRVC